MTKTLDDREVIRLVRRHCSETEKAIFNHAMQNAPHLVAATVNFCLAKRNLPEAAVIKELRRAIRLLKQAGTS